MPTLVPWMLLTLARSNAMHSTHELTLHAHMPGQSSAEASAEAQAVASGGGKATANAVSEVGEDVRMMRSERWMEASSLFTTESDPAKARCVKDAACPHRVTPGTCKHTCEHTHTHNARTRNLMLTGPGYKWILCFCSFPGTCQRLWGEFVMDV